MSTIKVVRAERAGGSTKGTSGASTRHGSDQPFRTGRVYADFVVDGFPLSSIVRRKADFISALGWGPEQTQRSVVDRLLLHTPADLPLNRNSLYVCPECGDLSCGAVSALIERRGDTIGWRDFAYENDYQSDPPDRRHLESLGEYTFSWTEYDTAIRQGFGLGGFE